MFLAEDLTVSTGSRAVQARFENLVHGDWLTGASEAAYDGAVTGWRKVGPVGPVATKLVRVSFLDPVYHGDVMTVGMRWEATGATGALFPVLDANITISPAGDETARLALAGCYRPPLGRLGAGLDRAVMHQVAVATMRSLLRNVAAALTSRAPAGHSAEAASPRLAPRPGVRGSLKQRRLADVAPCSPKREVVRVGQAEWWAEFKIFEDRDGSYSWQLQAASGRIIARSGHAYESKYWCVQDVNWLRANANLIMVYDHTGVPRRLSA